MELKKLAPWSWFKKEEEHHPPIDTPFTGSSEESVMGLQPHLDDFSKHLTAFLHRPFHGFHAPFPSKTATDMAGLLRPRLDLGEEKDRYVLSIELPGVDEKDVSITVEDNTLRIQGTKRRESEVHEGHYYRVERSYGSFQRVLSLPDEVDTNRIEATCKKGVLTIIMPRRIEKSSTAKSIEIR